MKRLCRNICRKKRGFTLVELMIVIIILAILTGIAVPSYIVLRNNAREAAAQTEMKNIATALELYLADNDTYPDDAAYPGALSGGGYMDPVPANDPWGVAYVYDCNTPFATYSLTSTGADPDIVIIDGQLQP